MTDHESVIRLLIEEHFPNYTLGEIALHQDCRICNWMKDNAGAVDSVYSKMLSPDDDNLAQAAWDRFIGRIKDDADVAIKSSWTALFNFARNVSSAGIDWDLNKISHDFVMPFGLLETLRTAEKELLIKAVDALRASEGLSNVDEILDEQDRRKKSEEIFGHPGAHISSTKALNELSQDELIGKILNLRFAIRHAAEAMEEEGIAGKYVEIYDSILNKAIGRRPHWAA